MKNKKNVIEFFCGAGGLSLGFKRAGFKTIGAFDNDESCIKTYNANFGNQGHITDIYSLNRKGIEKIVGCDIAVDVIAGGPPCQGFSVQRRGKNDDPRNNLVLEYLRLVLEFKPKFFVMENVGGLLSVRGKPFLTKLIKKTKAEGYILHINKLNAADYGVPQIRKRVFIIGELATEGLSKYNFPLPSIVASKHPITVRQAIADLTDKTEEHVPNHRADKLSAINIERIRSIKEGQSRDSLPTHLQLPCHINNGNHRHLDTYGRMAWDKPSSTITAKFDSFSRGRFGHPTLDRTISLREGARLQSFPDNFIFYGTKVEVAKQIGNAVPPLLAKAIAESILKCL